MSQDSTEPVAPLSKPIFIACANPTTGRLVDGQRFSTVDVVIDGGPIWREGEVLIMPGWYILVTAGKISDLVPSPLILAKWLEQQGESSAATKLRQWEAE